MKQVELVVTNFKRPLNVGRIAKALRSQSVDCTLTVVDAGSNECQLTEGTRHLFDRYYRMSKNHGSSNRYLLIGNYDHEFTMFLDDDYIPAPKMVEFFLRFARTSSVGVMGQEGRMLNKGGEYCAKSVIRTDQLTEVDIVVRGYFVRTSMLPEFDKFIRSNKIEYMELEDDIALSAYNRISGKRNVILPKSSEDARMVGEELPSPYARWNRPNHLERRAYFCKKFFELGWKGLRTRKVDL